MILTVTLNPVLDKNYLLDNFTVGGDHRLQHTTSMPAGKGINVSRILHRLKIPTLATGFLGGHVGRLIESELSKEGVPNDFLWFEAESRCSILIVDPLQATHTKLTEPGPHIPGDVYIELSTKLGQLAPGSDWVVFAGSPPPNAPADIYYRLIKRVRKSGVKVLLDTNGPWLKEGIKAQPDLIKPNWEEFLELVGSCYSTVQAIGHGRRLVEQGVGGVIISMGSKGALAVQDDQAYFSRPLPPVEVVSPIGGGDALVAGLLAKLQENWEFSQAFRFGLAVATASTAHFGTGIVDPQLASLLAKQITVEKTPY